MVAMDDWSQPLNELRHHWGSAYLIHCLGLGKWVAQRRDCHATIGAENADGLLNLIREDYAAHPVPRDMRPCRFLPEG
jgi:hypothetical protein